MRVELIHSPTYVNVDALSNNRPSLPLGLAYIAAALREAVERGEHGFIQYEYRIYQGPRKDSRTEAAAETATLPTDETGRETYRYTFSGSGGWNGGKGQRARR